MFNMKINPNFKMPKRGLFENSISPKNELLRQQATHLF